MGFLKRKPRYRGVFRMIEGQWHVHIVFQQRNDAMSIPGPSMFNLDVLKEHLLRGGVRVTDLTFWGGNLLFKSTVSGSRRDEAQLIKQVLDKHYPSYGGVRCEWSYLG